MAKGINKVILIGNVGQDPDIRTTQDGKPVANLSIATSESWTDQQGQKQEKTEWHKVVIFGMLADITGQYVKKGSKVYIEGKLQTKKWQDNSGQDRYTTEVVVNGFGGVMVLLDSRQDGGQQPQQQPRQNHYQQARNGQQPAPRQQQQNQYDQNIPY